MYNYFYRQNNASNALNKKPYALMQNIVSDIIELYHNEIKNVNMYESLMSLAPNMEQEEIIMDIIYHTEGNIHYLEQIYLGLTGDTIEQVSMPQEELDNSSYMGLLKNTLFSKTDTLEKYEGIYRLIPIQPYKDILFETIVSQIKDAISSNFLISIQSQPEA